VPCPLCWKKFQIPKSGFGGLTKNFFVEQLSKELTELKISSTQCEVCCSPDGTDVVMKKCASMLCLEFDERMCEDCAVNHGRNKMLRDHKVIKVGNKEFENAVKMKKINCTNHREENVKLYCFDCSAAVCMMCFVEKHQSHKCSDINEAADTFRGRMSHDVVSLEGTKVRCRDMIEEEEAKKLKFCSRLDAIEREICERAEKLKQSIDEESVKLVNELRTFKDDRMKQIDHVIQIVEHRVSFVEDLIEYTEHIREKGTAFDIAQQTNPLHARTTELVALEILQGAVKDLGSIDVTFIATASTASSESSGTLVGQLRNKIGTISTFSNYDLLPSAFLTGVRV